MTQTLGSAITISKGKKHEISESPSSAANRLIGIDDLRNDDLLRYTDDRKGVEAVPEDVLIAWDGANAGTIGYGKSGFIGSTIARLRIKQESKLFTPFLGMFLKSQFDFLRKTATGATIPHINRKALESIPLPTIEHDDQIRIAHLLGKVEGLIAQRKQHLKQLDDLLKSVFLEMFGDPVRNEKGWDVDIISNHCEVKGGKRIPKGEKLVVDDTGYPYIKAGNIKNGKVTTNDLEFVTPEVRKKIARYTADSGDVCITVVGANIGDVGIVPAELHKASLTENANKLLIKNTKIINNHYLAHYLMSNYVQQQINNSIRAAGVPKLAIFRIEQMLLLLPPIELQERFGKVKDKLSNLSSTYQQSLNDLESLYGVLSQQAFKGELDLSRVPLPDVQVDAEEIAPFEQAEMPEEDIAINLPDTDYLLDALTDLSLRERLLCEWLESYCQQIGNTEFSTDKFLAAAQTRIAELHPDSDFELGASDYEIVKNWVSDALEAGKLTQSLDDENNRIRLVKGKPA